MREELLCLAGGGHTAQVVLGAAGWGLGEEGAAALRTESSSSCPSHCSPIEDEAVSGSVLVTSEVKTLRLTSVFLVMSCPGRMAGAMEGHSTRHDIFQNKTKSTTKMAVQIAPALHTPLEYNL